MDAIYFREDLDEDLGSIDLSKNHISRSDIQTIIGIKPINLDLYRRAFVHKSINRHVKWSLANNREVCDYMKESFERLEFLGDAVLNLVVAKLLFTKYPGEDEGFLTRLRTKIVRGTNCVMLAKKLNLANYTLIGTKVHCLIDQSGSKIINDKILEDSFEALIGALYQDLGLDYSELFILKLINENIDFNSMTSIDDNYKDILMRYTQTFKFELPIYELVPVDLTQKQRTFNVTVSLKRTGERPRIYGHGQGRTKKEAEQNACKNSLCSKERSECHCSRIHADEISKIVNREYEKDSDDDYY
jgi:ribonuclease-3